jgi:hypothetical protein
MRLTRPPHRNRGRSLPAVLAPGGRQDRTVLTDVNGSRGAVEIVDGRGVERVLVPRAERSLVSLSLSLSVSRLPSPR